MEVRCLSSFSSPSQAPWSLRLPYFSENVNRTNFPNISGLTSHYCSITLSRVLLHRRHNLPSTPVLKQSPTLSFSRGIERGDDFGCIGSKKSSSLRIVPAGMFGVASLPRMGMGSRQGRFIDKFVPPFVCKVKFDSEQDVEKSQESGIRLDQEGEQLARVGQIACWVITVVYVGWLFILPYAPGDPVWAISPATIQMLIDLSLNFFYVLPIASSLCNAGASQFLLYNVFLPSNWCDLRAAEFHGLTAPVLHPTAEALFNIVIGWTLLFAPLLFTDRKRDRFSGSLETLWIIQMFLTNTVLAPYMAIRLNSSPADRDKASLPLGSNLDILSRGMTTGAYTVGIVGALVGLISILWALIGRPEAGFGGLVERWEYFINYIRSERLAYAFLWDIVLYTVFQPWLIGENLDNVKIDSKEAVQILRFVPYVGLVVYVLGLKEQETANVEQ